MAVEHVILVDEQDIEKGLMGKLEAHQKALLHRAFSIFVFNNRGELMMQQRALSKYHSPGLWTNTCCSHPRHKESLVEATRRRLLEEMGFQCELTKAFHFTYRADVGSGLTEHEFDHVFTGYYNEEPVINHEEVADWKWMSMNDIREDMSKSPQNYTVWFRIAFKEVESYLKK